MNRILALVAKEFHAIWRDRKTRAILLMPPLIQVIIFGFAVTLDVKDVPVAVLNHDRGSMGREFVARLRASSALSRLSLLAHDGQLQTVIDERRALLAVTVPEDFSRDLLAGRGCRLQVLLDGRRVNSAQIALGYVSAIAERWTGELPSAVAARARPSEEIVVRTWFNPNRNYRWFTVPGLVGVLMALEALLLTGLSVARERELGTFDQVLVSPLTPWEIILGKTVPSMIVGLGAGGLIVLVALFVFRIPFCGSPLLLLGGMVVYLLAMIGVGLFVSSLAETQQQALLGSFAVMIVIILLSGFVTPVEAMPSWLALATAWNPLRYFLVIVKGVFLKDMTAAMVFENAWPLLVIAAASLSVASWQFRRRLG